MLTNPGFYPTISSMPSMDFVRDLLENIESQGFDYVLVTAHRDKNDVVLNSYERIQNDSNQKAIAFLLQEKSKTMVA